MYTLVYEKNITLEIKEGKQYLVGDTKLTGNLVYPEKDVKASIAMKKGKPFSTRSLREDVFNLRQ